METVDAILNNPWGHGIVYGVVMISVFMGVTSWSIWFERKFAGRMQLRRGPTMVGPFGLLQPLADGIKMMRKEFIVPAGADPFLFKLAPPLTMFLAASVLAVVPMGKGVVVAPNFDMGVLWVLAFSGLMVFPIWIAGWAGSNKYSLVAAMRAVAQGISYEVPMLLCAMVPVVLAGSFNLETIVQHQADHGWLVWYMWSGSLPGGVLVSLIGIAAFVIFFLASLAEANRIPFDIPEAESELIAGVTVEYSSIVFGLFPMTEYLHTFIASAVASALFLGGWHGYGAESHVLIGVAWMVGKTLALFFMITWMRWTLVRFRADQLMRICWVYFVPISLALLCSTALAVHFFGLGV